MKIQSTLALFSCSLFILAVTGQSQSVVQHSILESSNPTNYERFGWVTAISGDTIVVGVRDDRSSGTGIDSTPDELAFGSGSAYVFVKNGSAWKQQAYLKASNTGELDQFGFSVAISGDTIVVGSPEEDGEGDSSNNSGAVYVFKRTGTTWSQEAYLKSGNTDVGHQFGYSVDIDGDTIIAGSPYENRSAKGINNSDLGNFMAGAGAAYTFVRQGRRGRSRLTSSRPSPISIKTSEPQSPFPETPR